MGRDGNRSAHAAPQGLYSCDGDDGGEHWIAVSVETDDQWSRADRGAGRPHARPSTPTWPTSPVVVATTTVSTRCSGGGPRGRTVGTAVEELIAVGVPAAGLSDPRRIHLHPQHRARGFVEDTPHAVLGSLPVFGMPFRMSGRDRWNDRPAPVVGEHNAEVLGGLLGLGDDEMAALGGGRA